MERVKRKAAETRKANKMENLKIKREEYLRKVLNGEVKEVATGVSLEITGLTSKMRSLTMDKTEQQA
jgi:hypothetical protein